MIYWAAAQTGGILVMMCICLGRKEYSEAIAWFVALCGWGHIVLDGVLGK
jgi:hypothetical protein